MPVSTQTQVSHRVADGLYETGVVREDGEELFLTATPRAGESLAALLARVAQRVRIRGIRGRGWRPVGMTVFNGTTTLPAAEKLLRDTFGDVAWPVTWLESEGGRCDDPAGVELHAVNGPEVRTIRLHGRIVGCTWEDAAARHCELGDLRPHPRIGPQLDPLSLRERAGVRAYCPQIDPCPNPPPAEQARQVLEDMAAALQQANMTFAHVYRTWFRNRDILGWYPDFNRVRTDFFTRLKVFDGLLPASTGIGAGHPAGGALVAGLWAMVPKSPGSDPLSLRERVAASSPPGEGVLAPTSPPRAFAVDSPLQDSARRYGSSFSRAVELDLGGHRLLTISGTASINPAGQTAHMGDAPAQVDLTMRVVRAILNSRGMDWPHVSRGVAYFRRAADMDLYSRWCRANQVAPMPVIVSRHTVCRDDLLYEIEVDAVADSAPVR